MLEYLKIMVIRYTQEIDELETAKAMVIAVQGSIGLDEKLDKRFLKVKFALMDIIDELKRRQGK